MADEERILRPGEAADLLGVDGKALVRLADEGVLTPVFRTAGGNGYGHRRYRESDVLALQRRRMVR